MEPLQLVLAVVGIAGLATLLDVALSLRAIRTAAEEVARKNWWSPAESALKFSVFTDVRHLDSSKSETGYSVWLHSGGKWVLEEDQSAEGYQPGPPPEMDGVFQGHRVRQEAVPAAGS